MVHYLRFVMIFLLFLGSVEAQDERYYRQMLSGALPEMNADKMKSNGKVHFSLSSPAYRIDLNSDGTEEYIKTIKRDGVDWLQITDFSGRKIFEQKLFAMGAQSVIYKIRFSQISDDVKALVVFLDEGKTHSVRFESTARIYVVSFEKNNLDSMKLSVGPHFYHEKEAQREQYWRRHYQVNLVDFDGDGIKEISVQYNHIQRMMKYVGRGEWIRL